MSKIVAVHSFRGGTGKSNLTANIACTLARGGRRVAIVDTDIQSPGIHVLFGLDEDDVVHSLNDYLWGKCAIEETAHDVTPPLVAEDGGQVFLVPSSIKPGDITRVLNSGYDVTLLNSGFNRLLSRLKLDYLFVDTHPGLNEETLLSVAIADSLVIILRPDRQDFQGTAVTVDVARKLDVPELMLVVNKAVPTSDREVIEARICDIERTYECPVVGFFFETQEMLELASNGIFCLVHPDHPFSSEVARVAKQIQE